MIVWQQKLVAQRALDVVPLLATPVEQVLAVVLPVLILVCAWFSWICDDCSSAVRSQESVAYWTLEVVPLLERRQELVASESSLQWLSCAV